MDDKFGEKLDDIWKWMILKEVEDDGKLWMMRLKEEEKGRGNEVDS